MSQICSRTRPYVEMSRLRGIQRQRLVPWSPVYSLERTKIHYLPTAVPGLSARKVDIRQPGSESGRWSALAGLGLVHGAWRRKDAVLRILLYCRDESVSLFLTFPSMDTISPLWPQPLQTNGEEDGYTGSSVQMRLFQMTDLLTHQGGSLPGGPPRLRS